VAKQHEGGENIQPLINHSVDFNSLLLCLVSFLQNLILYNRWTLLLNLSFELLCWILYVPGYNVDYFRAAELRKNDTAPASELFIS